MPEFYLYILKCSDGSYYTGHTDNLEARLASHQRGEIPGYTSRRRPVELAFAQGFPSRDEAFRAERQVKGLDQKKEAGPHRAGLALAPRALEAPLTPNRTRSP